MHRLWEKLLIEFYHYRSCFSLEANYVNVSQADSVISDTFCLDIGQLILGFMLIKVDTSNYESP